MRKRPSAQRWIQINQPFQIFILSIAVAIGMVAVALAEDYSGVTTGLTDSLKLAQAETKAETKAQTPKTSLSAASKNAARTNPSPAPKRAGEGKPALRPLPDTLRDVVTFAISNHPQIAGARARGGEAKAGIIVSEASNGFQLEGNLGTGVGAQSTTGIPLSVELLQQPNFGSGRRYVMSLTGKKLLYDFGATEKNITRAMRLSSAEEFNLSTRINDIGQSMAQAYLNVVETRDLARLNTENIAALEEIQQLVQLNQTNGNGTVADVKRVEARLVDARAVAADNEAQLQNALDRFQRLVKAQPGDLKPAPDLSDFTPAKVEAAIALLPQTSPRLRASEMSRRATELEIDAKKSSNMPQVVFQTDSTLKSYTGTYWNNLDA